MNLSKNTIVILSVFCPVLVIAAAFLFYPGQIGVAALHTTSAGWIFVLLMAFFTLFFFYLIHYIQHRTDLPGLFDKLDLDHDGYISEAEAHCFKDLNKVFNRFDKKRSGFLNRREFAKAIKATVTVPNSQHGGV